jgi:hypothetical protein
MGRSHPDPTPQANIPVYPKGYPFEVPRQPPVITHSVDELLYILDRDIVTSGDLAQAAALIRQQQDRYACAQRVIESKNVQLDDMRMEIERLEGRVKRLKEAS